MVRLTKPVELNLAIAYYELTTYVEIEHNLFKFTDLFFISQISLINKSLSEAQQILKCGHNSLFCTLTIEYEVSVMQTVEFSLGPLLIEIERAMNEQMGLVLSNFMPISSDFIRNDGPQLSGIFISSIIPASISDRCGALSVGDQILTVDETVVENTSFSPDDVLQLLDVNCTKGFTQIQILPANAILRRKGEQILKVLLVQL